MLELEQVQLSVGGKGLTVRCSLLRTGQCMYLQAGQSAHADLFSTNPKCLQWARESPNWNMEQWKKGAWC